MTSFFHLSEYPRSGILALQIIAVFFVFEQTFLLLLVFVLADFTGVLLSVTFNRVSIQPFFIHHCWCLPQAVFTKWRPVGSRGAVLGSVMRVRWVSSVPGVIAGCQSKKKKKNCEKKSCRPSQWELQLSVDVIPGAKQKSRRSIMRETGQNHRVFCLPHVIATWLVPPFNEFSNHLCQGCLLFALSACSFKRLLPVCTPHALTVIHLLASLL